MEVISFLRENFVRLMALVCLMIGLSDATVLLGVNTGNANPAISLGLTGFIMLAVFTLARLFAAVGLWINSSWGGVLLIGATFVEMAMVLSGNAAADLSFSSVLVRLALLLAILGSLGARYWHHRNHVHD